MRKYGKATVKELSTGEDGRLRIEGIASTEDVDADGEVIEVGGWEWGEPLPPLGYGHDWKDAKNVLGRLDGLTKGEGALAFSASINTTASAHHAMVASLVRARDLVEFSVGFEPLEYTGANGKRVARNAGDPWPYPEKGRRYTKQRLMELSIVPIPANAHAVLTAIKALGLAPEDAPPPVASEVYARMAECLGSGKTLLERAAEYQEAEKLYGQSAELPEPPEFRDYEPWELASIREFGVVVAKDWQFAVRLGLSPVAEQSDIGRLFQGSGAGR